MIRLACTPVGKNVFSLFILGANAHDNMRIVHLDTGVYVCSSVKIFLVNDNDELFDFKYTNKRTGFFSSSKNGKYKLKITSDLTLEETTDEMPYFIEVISRNARKLVKVEMANG